MVLTSNECLNLPLCKSKRKITLSGRIRYFQAKSEDVHRMFFPFNLQRRRFEHSLNESPILNFL